MVRKGSPVRVRQTALREARLSRGLYARATSSGASRQARGQWRSPSKLARVRRCARAGCQQPGRRRSATELRREEPGIAALDASDRRPQPGAAIGLRHAVHAQEPQGGSGGRRVQVRRCAGPGVPLGDRGARAPRIRPELPARPARLSLSVRPHAQEAGGGVRGPARERADEARRRDRRAQGMGRGARPARYVARLRGRAGGARDHSSSARPISARLRAKTSPASATGGLQKVDDGLRSGRGGECSPGRRYSGCVAQ